jgi:FG-GAP-like repeat/Abnormal spindle-like microcephaly-assoc'd, ASPM-SPD-2-Hydin
MRSLRILCAICVFALTLYAPTAFAQFYFFNRLDLTTGKSPQGVAVGDFNKDGISDFAVANSADGTISVYLGKPDGTFQAPTTLSTGAASKPTAVVAADFNGDGKLDLAVTLNGANNVMVFPGTGAGTFNTPLTFGVGTGPIALVAADFNGDKKLDLAVANNTASSVTILINNSSTTISFTTGSTISSGLGLNPTCIIAADFNGDKKLDLAVGSSGSNEVSVMLGTGSGTFGAPINDNAGQPVSAIAAADFDKDGKLDLVSAGIFGVSLQLGNGDGTFQSNLIGMGTLAGADALYPLDVNGDKKVDLITVDFDKFDAQTTISVVINTTTTIGNPTFAFPPSSYATGYQPRAIAIADFNFDGKPDAVVTGSGSDLVSVLLGDGKGHFDGRSSAKIGTGQCQFMTTADFNNDHKADVAFSCTSGEVLVFLGKGTGAFNAPIILTAGSIPQGIVAADFNGDGFLDLAVANKNSNNISVFLNNKSGGFNAPVNYKTGNGPIDLTAGNFTLAGHVDLAVVNNTDSTLQIFPGSASGTFGSPSTFALPAVGSPQGIAAGDFNNDGKLDLAVANVGASSVSILLNNSGTFSTRSDITVGGQPTRIATASLRNNGVLDLVTTAAAIGEVQVLLGKNNGTFAAPVAYPAHGAEGLSLGDFNHDGFLDIAVATVGNTISVLPGKGDGTFLPLLSYQQGLQNGSQPWDVAAVDLNGDGFTDFVSSNIGDGTYSVFLNTAVAALHPAKMSFPTLLLGSTSAAQTATIFSSGVATLKPKITLSPSDYAQTSNTCGSSLIAGANCSVRLTFSPKDINTRAGSLSFADNATDTPQKVSLSGVGSEVGVSPDPVPFGSVTHGTSTTKVVTITNLSGGSFPAHALTFTGTVVSGTAFSLVTNGCPVSPSSLAAGANCQLTLKFAPATTGNFNGLLTLTDNGGGSPQKIALSGSGT